MACLGTMEFGRALVATAKQHLEWSPFSIFEDAVVSSAPEDFQIECLRPEKTSLS